MSRFRSNRLHFSEVLVLIAIVLIIATMMFSIVILPFLNVETNTITVTKVENIVDGKNSTYLLFTESEVFENSDCFIRGKFDSSDFYNQFKDLGTFEVKTYGYRIPFFSMYKNEIGVKLLEHNIKVSNLLLWVLLFTLFISCLYPFW